MKRISKIELEQLAMEEEKNRYLKKQKKEKLIVNGLKIFSSIGLVSIIVIYFLQDPPIEQIKLCQSKVINLNAVDEYREHDRLADENELQRLKQYALIETEPAEKNYLNKLNISMEAQDGVIAQTKLIALKAEYNNSLKSTTDAINKYVSDSSRPKSNITFEYLGDCDLDYFEDRYKDKIDELKDKLSSIQSKISSHQFEMSRQTALEGVDKMNAEIDAAQDDVISKYRKQSVRTYLANGAGNVKVEAFVLKNGSTIFCKTIITNAGKAVDCHE